jgi:DnaJ like chaperone protein
MSKALKYALGWGFLGSFFFGPVGTLVCAALGYATGQAKDEALRRQTAGTRRQRPHRSATPDDFTLSYLVLVAAVMKADGRVTRAELDTFKAHLRQTLPPDRATDALHALRDLLSRDIPVLQVCEILRRNMNVSQRRTLLYLLFSIAAADDRIIPAESEILRSIATQLDLSPDDLASIAARFSSTPSPDDDYRILGVSPDASDDEVRRAYRRMAMKHHPDKVAHLGPSYQQAANGKFRQINAAYDRIKRARGLS